MAITKIGTPELFDFSATNTALQLPTGDTASRPSAPSTGEWRYNTELKYVEYYDGAAWFQIDTEADANPDDFPSQNFNVNTYFGNGATQAIDAKFNEAANFNGSSSNIQIANDSFTYTTMTFSAWVNPSANDTYNYIFQIGMYDNRIGGSIGWYVRRESGGSLLARGFSSNSLTVAEFDVTSASSLIPLNTWTNVVCVLTPTSFNIYINGNSTAVASATFSNAITYSASQPSAVVIGATYYYFNAVIYESWWEGAIDQVRIFNTALTSAQVEDLYTDETTTTAATLNFPAGAGCVAAYQLDGDASDVGGTYGGVTTDIGYTGLKFQADLIWIKSRNAASDHTLTDSVRGVQELLSPNTNAGEGNQSPNGMTNFGANSFSVTDVSSGGAGVNGPAGGANSGTPPGYVAWCWKAGGAPTATNSAGAGNVPTAGSVKIDGADSTIADAGTTAVDRQTVNTKNGFSITTYTPSGGAYTVSHGFTSAPDLIIIKGVSTTEDWLIYNSYSGTGKYLSFNRGGGTESLQTRANSFSAVTSTTFTDNWTSASLQWVAYCFKNIDGYQRVGTYTGDGNTSGNFVYTTSDGTASGTDGFEPAFLLLKNITTAGTSWLLYDNKRTPTNPIQTALIAGSSGADVTTSTFKINFFTNGFEVTGNGSDINGSGDTFIYLAIAADKDTSVPTQANSFSPLSYSGTGALQNLYTPFAPDLSWIKSISNNTSHELNDSVRGQVSRISTDTTGAASDVANGFLSLDPNGFSLNDAGGGGEVNTSGRTYVGWSWKAGGLPTINNDGTITSIVSANQAAGFSIVKYTGNNTQNATVGHGLGIEPKMVIIKRLDVANAWWIPLPVEGSNKFMEFSTASATTDVQYQYTQTTDVFKFTSANQSAQYNASGGSYIMYSFADIANYQKIGTYTGSNSSSKVVPTGFQPRFLLIKSLTSNGNYWNMFDSARTSAPNGKGRLYANGNFAEDGTLDISFDSTSFEILTSNSDINGGNDYLYLAIG